jgi:hypothetical protein
MPVGCRSIARFGQHVDASPISPATRALARRC